MVRNIYFIAFNRYLIRKNTTNYSKSQQTTEAEAGHFLYFDCKCTHAKCMDVNGFALLQKSLIEEVINKYSQGPTEHFQTGATHIKIVVNIFANIMAEN